MGDPDPPHSGKGRAEWRWLLPATAILVGAAVGLGGDYIEAENSMGLVRPGTLEPGGGAADAATQEEPR